MGSNPPSFVPFAQIYAPVDRYLLLPPPPPVCCSVVGVRGDAEETASRDRNKGSKSKARAEEKEGGDKEEGGEEEEEGGH